jgi:DNA primase
MSNVSSVIESLADQYLKWWRRSSDGKNIYGACPFHHESTEGAFYMSTENGLFICHACQARGSLSTFLKEIGAPSRIRTAVMDSVGPALIRKDKPSLATKDQFENHMPLSEGILGIFDFCPTLLIDAGFDKKILQTHEVGFDKGANRITFPLRNHLGVLMGLAGRTVVGEKPRYKIYKEKDFLRFSAKYKGYDIQKKNFIWNFHNVYPKAFHGEVNAVYVVEGYKAALWLIQHGYINTVALMGTYLSDMQRALLQRLSADIYVFLDNTDSARKGVCDAGDSLRNGNKVFVCEYPARCLDGEQPDSLTAEELKTVITEAESFNTWRFYYERSQPVKPTRARQLRS